MIGVLLCIASIKTVGKGSGAIGVWIKKCELLKIVSVSFLYPKKRTLFSISNSFTFDFNLLNDLYNYDVGTDVLQVRTDTGLLQKYTNRTTFTNVSGWTKANKKSSLSLKLFGVFISNLSLSAAKWTGDFRTFWPLCFLLGGWV